MMSGRFVFTLTALASAAIAGLAQTPPTPRSLGTADGWVVIPVEEYRTLRARAHPLDPDPPPPPIEWALTRIDCDLRVDGKSATGEAVLTVDVLKEGWVRLALPQALTIRSARIENRPVALVSEAGHDPAVLFSKVGRTILTLEIATPVTEEGGTTSFFLPSSTASIFRVAARIPGAALDVDVSGGVVTKKEETATETRMSVTVRPGAPLNLSWRGRRAQTQTPGGARRFRGDVTEIVGLGEESALTTVHASIDVTQGALDSVSFTLPSGFIVNQVSGPLVADWELSPGSLKVAFLEPVTTNARLVIQAETKTPRDGSIDVPLVRLVGAEREAGGVAVEVLGAGEIKSHRATGFDATDPSALGPALAGRDSPSLSAFRLRPLQSESRSLAVNVARYTPQAVLLANIEEARYETLFTDEGKRLTRARYAVRNNQRSFLTIALPRGATLWSASVAGKPVRPGLSPTGALLVPLQKTRGGEEAPAFAIEVTYFDRAESWTREGRLVVPLPSLDLPTSRTGVLIHHSPEFRLSADRGAFRAADFEVPTSPALRDAESTEAFGSGSMGAREEKSKDAKEDVLNDLAQRYRQEARPFRLTATLPVQVAFPEVGATTFLISELTAEGATPSLALTYQKAGKQ